MSALLKAKPLNEILADAFINAAGIAPSVRVPIPLDAWTFCRECVFTQDEHASARGAHYIRPLVGECDEYLRVIAGAVRDERLLRVEKSRQLRVTWLICALLLHRVLVKNGTRIAYQAKKYDDADAYLRDRFWFIYQHIPEKYKVPRARYIDGRIEVYGEQDALFKAAQSRDLPTSQIQAIAQGAEQVRQFTFSVWWSDEFGFQEQQDESLTAVKPSLDGGGQGIITSSAAGDQNAFYRIGYESGAYGSGGEVRPEKICEGVRRWMLNGWCTLNVHYSADPNKRGDWAKKAREGYSTQAWAQEQEIDFTIQPGDPVFCDTDRIDTTGQNYSPQLPLVSGFDYSFLANVCLTGQVRRRLDGRHELRILNELSALECTIKPFRDQVLADRKKWFAGHAAGYVDYGDFAANQRTATGVLIEEIRPIELITIPTGPGGVRKGLEVIQYLISQKLLAVDPSCEMLLRCLRGAYVWSKKVDQTGSPIPCGDHPFSDHIDALRYLVINLFELQDLENGGHEVVLKEGYRGSNWSGEPTRAMLVDDGDLQGVTLRKIDLGYSGRRGSRR